ncbi:MAG: Wzz/FepE/Etk N-terminal domain-containing protein, partial [SAR324 cluster bacterium]|nr:Wzz/FepE/Etk N-terminal domain-containing protein [SAR324 cluster bacterium]
MAQADPKSPSGQEQQQTSQTDPYPSPYPQHFEDDTIDLYELWITLWKWKWLVIGLTVVAALGSVVYALATPSIYKAKALLLPPKAKDIKSMNVLVIQNQFEGNTRFSSTTISANDVFNKFKQ